MTKVDCPVCGKTDLADHLAQCPQCNADLECFRLLEALYEEQSTPGVEAEVVRSLSRRVEDIGLLCVAWRLAAPGADCLASRQATHSHAHRGERDVDVGERRQRLAPLRALGHAPSAGRCDVLCGASGRVDA